MDDTYLTNFVIKPELDLLNSPEKESDLRMNDNCEEDAMRRNASRDYMQCSSSSPSLRSDFCNQICRIFDESDNREQNDEQLCCSSSSLPPEQQNATEEDVRSSFLNSIVNDLLCQRPAQLDVLVSGKEKRNERTNEGMAKKYSNSELLRGRTSAAIQRVRSSAIGDKGIRHQSEPPHLAEDISSRTHNQHSNITETGNRNEGEKLEISYMSNLNSHQINFVDDKNEQNCRQLNSRSEENVAERSAFDPVTKRRFYEPHKRSGCNGEYCLSQITQIGERICNVENKLTRLSELFHELIENTETPAHYQENGRMPIQQRHRVVRSSNTLAKGPQPQRLAAALPPSPYFSAPRASQLCAQSSAAPQIDSNTSHFLNSSTIPHNNSNFLSASQPKSLKHFVQPNTLTIPSKVLEYGFRIHFPENEAMKGSIANATVCPICFAKIEPFTNLSAHVLRHLDKKYMAEFFSCKLCKGSNSVHFLSVPAIREHIRSAHGVATDSYLLINIYPGNNTQKGTTRTMVQEVLKRFAMVRFEQWRNISQIKAKLSTLKRNCALPSVPWSKKQSQKKVEEKQKKVDVVDRIIFSSSQIPKNISDRFHRMKRIDRVSTDHLFVPICESSFVGLSNVRISRLVASCASQKRE